MQEIAIIGPTASGKSSVALKLAQETNSIIFSIDSLSVYKYINIASAKPSNEELNLVKHFGIDEVDPSEYISVMNFVTFYYKAKQFAKINKKNLIIVGGSSFYLKMMIDGISKGADISIDIREKVDNICKDLNSAYKLLQEIDKTYAKKIDKNDKYRIKKALSIYFQTNKTPSKFFRTSPKKKIIDKIPIFEIAIDKDILRKNIEIRTDNMIKQGLIDEVIFLEKRYKRNLQSMQGIGIVEVLDYLDSRIDKKQLIKKIVTNTYRLAKRQVTFNKSQFKEKILLPKDDIYTNAKKYLLKL